MARGARRGRGRGRRRGLRRHHRLGGGRDDLPEAQLRGLAQALRLVALLARNGDDDVVAVEEDLGAADADPVDAPFDDLARLVQGLAGRLAAVGGAGGERDPGAALQVDAQLRGRLVVAGEEHQRVQDDHDQGEQGEIASRAEMPG